MPQFVISVAFCSFFSSDEEKKWTARQTSCETDLKNRTAIPQDRTVSPQDRTAFRPTSGRYIGTEPTSSIPLKVRLTSYAVLSDLLSFNSTESASARIAFELLACCNCTQHRAAETATSGRSSHRPACFDWSQRCVSKRRRLQTYRFSTGGRPPLIADAVPLMLHLAEPRLLAEVAESGHVVHVMPARTRVGFG